VKPPPNAVAYLYVSSLRLVTPFDSQIFEWPLASNIEDNEMIAIDVYNFNKVFSNR